MGWLQSLSIYLDLVKYYSIFDHEQKYEQHRRTFNTPRYHGFERNGPVSTNSSQSKTDECVLLPMKGTDTHTTQKLKNLTKIEEHTYNTKMCNKEMVEMIFLFCMWRSLLLCGGLRGDVGSWGRGRLFCLERTSGKGVQKGRLPIKHTRSHVMRKGARLHSK